MLNKLASEIKLEINSLQSKMRIANKDVEIKKDIFNNDYVSIKNREQSAYDPASLRTFRHFYQTNQVVMMIKVKVFSRLVKFLSALSAAAKRLLFVIKYC